MEINGKIISAESFIEDVSVFQKFAEKRGKELIKAKGSTLKFYDFSEEFEFEENTVRMVFEEVQVHYPEREGVLLSIAELEKTEEEWILYLKEIEDKLAEEKRKKKNEEAKNKLEADKKSLEEKQKLFQKLKEELGY